MTAMEVGAVVVHLPTGAMCQVRQVDRGHAWIRPVGGGRENRVPLAELTGDGAISAGALAEARTATDRLAAALAGADIAAPGLAVDGRVWDSPSRGAVRLIALGHVLPDAAHELASLVELAVRARHITDVVRSRRAAA
ncbi:hypothetical protein [Streptomyces bohaiensis]|uniref:hypothetical protein n=1 Tax=Streptomyces bohaiensis TaxID=1431344 RepID=UPI003B81C1BF